MLRRSFVSKAAMMFYPLMLILVPWEALQGMPFVDRAIYSNYFQYETNILEYKDLNNIWDYISNEALWHLLTKSMVDKYNFRLDYMFSSISFLCLGAFSYLLINKHGPLAPIFLINPLIIDFAFSQSRLALAIALVIFATCFKNRTAKILLFAAALCIHTSILLFALMYLFAKFSARLCEARSSKTFPLLLAVLTGVIISLAIGPFRASLLAYLGDRRAEYPDLPSTILYSAFWIGLLGVITLQRRNYFRSEGNLFAVMILSIVTVNVITGGYSTRFIAAGFPTLVSAMISLESRTKVLTLSLFVFYSLFQWIYWLQLQ